MGRSRKPGNRRALKINMMINKHLPALIAPLFFFRMLIAESEGFSIDVSYVDLLIGFAVVAAIGFGIRYVLSRRKSPSAPPTTGACPECATPIEPNSGFCANCGMKLK